MSKFSKLTSSDDNYVLALILGEGDSGNDHEDDMEEEGIGLLHLKNLQMSEYLSNLVYLALRKSHGKSISGEPAIDRIVEQRTVLEKIRPMEKKLKVGIVKSICVCRLL